MLSRMFQSSSGPGAGCNPLLASRRPRLPSFNPHPAQGPDATRWAGCGSPPRTCFNPHPAQGPDATAVSELHRYAHPVSILIRPRGRMQRSLAGMDTTLASAFQSSSGPGAGCNVGVVRLPESIRIVSILIRPRGRMQHDRPAHDSPARTRFQSSSGPGAGCNERAGPVTTEHRVSILIRPRGRMQRPDYHVPRGRAQVSILIRPRGRMQLASWAILRRFSSWFQSSSGPGAGCNMGRQRPLRTDPCFNPHPAQGPDATPKDITNSVRSLVSILIRPRGRMQPGVRPAGRHAIRTCNVNIFSW